MSAILSFIPLLLIIAIAVLVVRKISNKGLSTNSTAQPVRLFFQYALTLGLFITFAVGLAGLLGRLLGASKDVVADQSSLASNLAFVVVSGPLLAWLLNWLKKSIARNPLEAAGFIPNILCHISRNYFVACFLVLSNRSLIQLN